MYVQYSDILTTLELISSYSGFILFEKQCHQDGSYQHNILLKTFSKNLNSPIKNIARYGIHFFNNLYS